MSFDKLRNILQITQKTEKNDIIRSNENLNTYGKKVNASKTFGVLSSAWVRIYPEVEPPRPTAGIHGTSIFVVEHKMAAPTQTQYHSAKLGGSSSELCAEIAKF